MVAWLWSDGVVDVRGRRKEGRWDEGGRNKASVRRQGDLALVTGPRLGGVG